MKALITTSVVGMCLWLQGTTPIKPRTGSTRALSEGVFAGLHTLHVLKDEPKSAIFLLTTSWIPGRDRKGYIRYKVEAAGVGVSDSETAAYIGKLHACSFTLAIHDKGDFVLDRIELTFLQTVDEKGSVFEMNANDLAPMQEDEYKRFLLEKSWEMAWTC